MKKHFILFAIIMITFCNLCAQNNYNKLISTNKVWNNIGTNPPWEYTRFYKFSSDTSVINAKTYYWLKKSNDSINWQNDVLMREDTVNKKVYVYDNYRGEGLIYDFGVNEGDTVSLFNSVMCYDTCKILITDIDSVLIGNQYRKKFNFDILINQACFQLSNLFIEGIGYEYGIYNIGGSSIGGFMPRLVCYYENDTLKYTNPYYGSCFTTTVGVENTDEQESITFENLSNNALKIIAKEDIKEIAIFDITGQKLYYNNFSTNELILNLNNYPAGLYFIKVLMESNRLVNKKTLRL